MKLNIKANKHIPDKLPKWSVDILKRWVDSSYGRDSDILKVGKYLAANNLVRGIKKPVYRVFGIDTQDIRTLFYKREIILGTHKKAESYTTNTDYVKEFIKDSFESDEAIIFKWPKVKKKDVIVDFSYLGELGLFDDIGESEIVCHPLCIKCDIKNIPLLYVSDNSFWPDQYDETVGEYIELSGWDVENPEKSYYWYMIDSKKSKVYVKRNVIQWLQSAKV